VAHGCGFQLQQRSAQVTYRDVLSQYVENRVRVFSIFGEFGEQRIPVSPRVRHSHQEFLAFDDNELYVWSTETFSVVAHDHVPPIEPEEGAEPSTTWILNHEIPNDSPICDSLHPSKTTTALIQYSRFSNEKEESTCHVDSPSLDLQSAAFIGITGHGFGDAIMRLYQEGCNPYVDEAHSLRLGKHVIFSVMTT
jgi:hypothetical protein